MTKVGKDCRSTWSTATTILFESEFEAHKATIEMATESPEDGGANIHGAGNKSANRLLNLGSVVGIMKNFKSQ